MPDAADLTCQQVIDMFAGLGLPVCDDAHAIEQKINEQSARFLSYLRNPDPKLQMQGKEWFAGIEAIRNRRPELLEAVLRRFVVLADSVLAASGGVKMTTQIQAHLLSLAVRECGTDSILAARFLTDFIHLRGVGEAAPPNHGEAAAAPRARPRAPRRLLLMTLSFAVAATVLWIARAPLLARLMLLFPGHTGETEASNGAADEEVRIGDQYYEGKGVPQNFKEAYRWYRPAAERGHPAAQRMLGLMYREGHGVEQSYPEAMLWFRKAAVQGDPWAQCYLGDMYAFAQGVSRDYEKSVPWYRKAADQGFVWGQVHLGWAYRDGQGINKDELQAAHLFRMAADHGNAFAQVSLAALYKSGLGVPQDDREAALLYRKAADQANISAQVALAELYEEGRGVDRDERQAANWYREAAEHGNADAQYKLGTLYVEGRGVTRDHTQAVEWWRKAAAQGNEPAQRELEQHNLER